MEDKKYKYDLAYRKEHYTQIKIEIPKEKAQILKEYAKKQELSMPKYILKCIEFFENSINE